MDHAASFQSPFTAKGQGFFLVRLGRRLHQDIHSLANETISMALMSIPYITHDKEMLKTKNVIAHMQRHSMQVLDACLKSKAWNWPL